MKHGIGLNKILGTIHIYPTLAEANKYAAGVWKKAHAPAGRAEEARALPRVDARLILPLLLWASSAAAAFDHAHPPGTRC